MILSFKEKFPWGNETGFEQKIGIGLKIHSIREDKTGRWKVGNKIHMARGVRTKNYHCFCDTECCKSTQTITILHRKEWPCPRIWIGDEPFFITTDVKNQLAKNDGFDSVGDFFKWFNKDFTGVIIHWTDKRY